MGIASGELGALWLHRGRLPGGHRRKCDCALGFTTDMPYHAPTLVMLQDNPAFFPPSHLAGNSHAAVTGIPELEELLSDLTQAIDRQALADMQRALVEEKPAKVAKRFRRP